MNFHGSESKIDFYHAIKFRKFLVYIAFLWWHFPSFFSSQNSIRHNLSLHNRFMRVQNEGTGKSSWWMLNPDAKPGKSVRRRAASMETSKFEKRRGRVKKRVEQIRNGVITSWLTFWLSSVCGKLSESLILFDPKLFENLLESLKVSSLAYYWNFLGFVKKIGNFFPLWD